ncbi:MAG: hypothetical protein KIT33_00475 [Candidatus Kapabacteria bacterium]|nr:hypothetical protein [Ignavibacteriota bacterium]MCW5883423.1 hypothetical protein [Candidatus Kapabacteria bacterium]
MPAPSIGIVEHGSVGKAGKLGKISKNVIQSYRKNWLLTMENASSVKNHKSWGNFFKGNDGLWWSSDKFGHGGSKFKVFKESNQGLEWYKDADEFGDFIINKHKGPKGLSIPWTEFKTIK